MKKVIAKPRTQNYMHCTIKAVLAELNSKQAILKSALGLTCFQNYRKGQTPHFPLEYYVSLLVPCGGGITAAGSSTVIQLYQNQ